MPGQAGQLLHGTSISGSALVEVPLKPDMQSPRGDPSLRAAADAVGKGLLSVGNTGTLLNVASWSQGYSYREQLGEVRGELCMLAESMRVGRPSGCCSSEQVGSG